MKFPIFYISLISACLNTAQAQSIASEFRTNGKKTLAVFEKQRLVLQDNSVVIYRGYKRIVYGVIMSADGYILTKASELEAGQTEKPTADESAKPAPELSIRYGENHLVKEVEIIAIDTASDIALLKINVENLKPVTFAKNSNIAEGRWVVTNGASSRWKRRVCVGVLSANTRKIDGPSPVTLGVAIEELKDSLLVKGVAPEQGAAKAGIKKDDKIIAINGKKVTTVIQLREFLFGLDPEEKVQVSILRAKKPLEIEVQLTKRPKPQMPRRMNKNDSMSGRFSLRRDGFSRVLQVDIPLARESCGGPVLTLDGKCIGMTIARANRAETFVTPLEEMKDIFKKLKKRQ